MTRVGPVVPAASAAARPRVDDLRKPQGAAASGRPVQLVMCFDGSDRTAHLTGYPLALEDDRAEYVVLLVGPGRDIARIRVEVPLRAVAAVDGAD